MTSMVGTSTNAMISGNVNIHDGTFTQTNIINQFTEARPGPHTLKDKLRPDIGLLHNSRKCESYCATPCVLCENRASAILQDLVNDNKLTATVRHYTFPKAQIRHSVSVALHFARGLDDEGCLLASSIFPASWMSHSYDVSTIIRTISHHISKKIPGFAHYVESAINADPDILDGLDSRTQLRELIEIPLRSAARDARSDLDSDMSWPAVSVIYGPDLMGTPIGQEIQSTIARLSTEPRLRDLQLVILTPESESLLETTVASASLATFLALVHTLMDPGTPIRHSYYFGWCAVYGTDVQVTMSDLYSSLLV